ncbi:hypothetical protein MKW98_023506, partial [Papaver atlanticum]
INPFVSLKKPIEPFTLHYNGKKLGVYYKDLVGELISYMCNSVPERSPIARRKPPTNVFTSGRARRGLSQSLGELIPCTILCRVEVRLQLWRVEMNKAN